MKEEAQDEDIEHRQPKIQRSEISESARDIRKIEH